MPQVNSVATRSGAVRMICGSIMLAGLLAFPFQSHAQVPATDPSTPLLSSRWEVSVDGRVGAPSGYVKVGEVDSHGTRLRLRGDLGIDVSEAVEGNLALRLTPRDTIRGTLLYYFLDGSTTINRPITYNGPTFPPGHLSSNLDFYRLSLSYDRQFVTVPGGGVLTGSIGLTYVSLDAVVHGNHEDFYRQELPVPIAGFHFDYPVLDRLSLTASVSGGALPRVDSLAERGGHGLSEPEPRGCRARAQLCARPGVAVTCGLSLHLLLPTRAQS